MKTSFERISTSDGLELHGLIYYPEQPTKKAILHIHGMAGNFYENRFLDFLANALTKNGYIFAVFNNRGHDFQADFRKTNTEKEEYKRIGQAFEIFEECVFDIEAGIDFLERSGYTEIYLSGHSLGCSKVAYYQGIKNDKRIKAIILEAAPFMKDDAKRETNFNKLIETAEQLINENNENEILTEKLWECYNISAKTFVNFFGENAKTDIFNLDSRKPTILSKIKVPILVILGDKDGIILTSAEEDLLTIKAEATECTKFDYCIIKGAPHSYFAHEQELADTILGWLNNF